MSAFNFEMEIQKLLRPPHNLVISLSYFPEDGKDMYKALWRTSTAIVCLFGYVLVAVVMVVCLSFLVTAG